MLKREAVKVNEGICLRCGKVIKLSRPEPAGDYANVRATWECECGLRNVYPQMIQPKEEMKMELMDTVRLMESTDYKDRFKAEYWQVRIRLERLRKMIAKYQAGTLGFTPACSLELLKEQVEPMQNYLDVLEVRAQIEEIEL